MPSFGKKREEPGVPEFRIYYRGGHPMFPPEHTVIRFRLLDEAIEVLKHNRKPMFSVKYEDLSDVKTETREKSSAGNVIFYTFLGLVVGALFFILWGLVGVIACMLIGLVVGVMHKDKHHFLILEFKDELGKERKAEFEGTKKTIYKLPPIIYQKLKEVETFRKNVGGGEA